MDTLLQDIRYAIRGLLRSPLPTLVAAVTIALGIAATTVIFSAVNALLLRPLPYAEADRLMDLEEMREGGQVRPSFSYPRYIAYRDETRALSGLAAYGIGDMALRGEAGAEEIFGFYASGNYFEVLGGLAPAAGRFFGPAEDAAPGEHPVAVLGYDLWQRRFGGDATVVGRTIHLNSQPVTVVGVAPRGFGGTLAAVQGDVWLPIAMKTTMDPAAPVYTQNMSWLIAFGRLAPGSTREQAKSELDLIAQRQTPEREDARQAVGMRVSRHNGIPASFNGPIKAFLALLFGTASFVLLIASTNVGGMLLARGESRRREIAIRMAVGAGRGRLIRQLLVESVLLFLIGGGAAVLLATWTADLLTRLRPPVPIRLELDFGIEPRVLGFALLVSLVTGVLFGLAPALQASRPDLVPALKDARGGGDPRRARLRSAFVVGQLALSLVLLVGAGLFVRAFRQALTADPGFDGAGIAVATFDVRPHGYDEARGRVFFSDLLDRLAASPEIEAASLADIVPLSGNEQNTVVRVPGSPAADEQGEITLDLNVVGAGYLELMRIGILAGRGFTAADREGAPRVAVLNETAAARIWPDGDAIGRRFVRAGEDVEVVGIARDGKYRSYSDQGIAYAYFPAEQNYVPQGIVHVRARGGDLPAALAAVRREAALIDANIPAQQAMPLSAVTGIILLPQRIASVLVGIFGVVGLILAAIGVYGVLAYSVSQRTAEFGIRLALGARATDLLRLVLRQATVLIGLGLGIGLAAAFALSRLLAGLLYGLSATDVVTFTAVPAILAGIGLLASWIPARRAAGVHPMEALRGE